MLIVGDETRHHGMIPWVTGSLVLINVFVFVLETALGPKFVAGFSLVPKEITTGRDIVGPRQVKAKVPVIDSRGQERGYKEDYVRIPHSHGPFPIYLTFFTCMFLHAGIGHLLGNMWFLGIFGRNVEFALGHGRFLAYYLISGVMGGILHVISDPDAIVPCVGASGAISGVMGAYLAVFPFNKVKVWLWLCGVNVPAMVVLGLWFLIQYFSAIALDHRGAVASVAYAAHLGGFLTGLCLIFGTIVYYRFVPDKKADKSQPNQSQEAQPPSQVNIDDAFRLTTTGQSRQQETSDPPQIRL